MFQYPWCVDVPLFSCYVSRNCSSPEFASSKLYFHSVAFSVLSEFNSRSQSPTTIFFVPYRAFVAPSCAMRKSFSVSLVYLNRRASSGPRDSPPPYDTFEEFASDVRNVFSKAIAYHGGGANDVSNAVSDGLSRDGGDGPGQQVQQHSPKSDLLVVAARLRGVGRSERQSFVLQVTRIVAVRLLVCTR